MLPCCCSVRRKHIINCCVRSSTTQPEIDPPIIYQDFVNTITAVVQPTTTPNKPHCSICSQIYGALGPGVQTNLELLSELPRAGRKAYAQHVVEAVETPCGHNYCTYCIAMWFCSHKDRTCPLCREPIVLPLKIEEWDDDWDSNDLAVDGLRSSLGVSSPTAEQIFDILKMSMHRILTTETAMPLVWKSAPMVSDLPKIMVAIAWRFNRMANGVVPTERAGVSVGIGQAEA
jgi:hypothetical protein